MMKKSLTIFLACALTVLFSSCSFRLSDLTYVQKTLKGLTAESFDVNVLGVDEDDWVFGEKKFMVEDLVEKQDPSIGVREVIACKGDRVYFSTSRKGYWGVSSIRTDGTGLTEHFERSIHANSNMQSDPNVWSFPYYRTGKIDFSTTGTFCYNGKIIMFDQEFVCELDIFTEKVAEYPTEQYTFPKNDCSIYISYDELYKATGELIPLTWIAEKSDVFRQILELKDFKCWGGDSPLEYSFFSVQQIDERTYFIYEVLDWGGHAYAVVFSYDPLTENVAYLWYQYTGDHPSDYRLVPVYEESK